MGTHLGRHRHNHSTAHIHRATCHLYPGPLSPAPKGRAVHNAGTGAVEVNGDPGSLQPFRQTKAPATRKDDDGVGWGAGWGVEWKHTRT